MRTDTDTSQPLPARITVETNHGGDILVEAVREALSHLPVRVVAVVRTGRTRP